MIRPVFGKKRRWFMWYSWLCDRLGSGSATPSHNHQANTQALHAVKLTRVGSGIRIIAEVLGRVPPPYPAAACRWRSPSHDPPSQASAPGFTTRSSGYRHHMIKRPADPGREFHIVESGCHACQRGLWRPAGERSRHLRGAEGD